MNQKDKKQSPPPASRFKLIRAAALIAALFAITAITACPGGGAPGGGGITQADFYGTWKDTSSTFTITANEITYTVNGGSPTFTVKPYQATSVDTPSTIGSSGNAEANKAQYPGGFKFEGAASNVKGSTSFGGSISSNGATFSVTFYMSRDKKTILSEEEGEYKK